VTTQVNPELGKAESIFKALIWDSVFEAEMIALFSAAPYLNFWPVNSIIRGLLKLGTDQLFSALQLFVDTQTIALVNAEHQRAFDKATVALKIIAKDKGIDSPEFKKAKENAKVALSRFVRFNQ